MTRDPFREHGPKLLELTDEQLQIGLETLLEAKTSAAVEGRPFPPGMADLLAVYGDERARREAFAREIARMYAIGEPTCEPDDKGGG